MVALSSIFYEVGGYISRQAAKQKWAHFCCWGTHFQDYASTVGLLGRVVRRSFGASLLRCSAVSDPFRHSWWPAGHINLLLPLNGKEMLQSLVLLNLQQSWFHIYTVLSKVCAGMGMNVCGEIPAHALLAGLPLHALPSTDEWWGLLGINSTGPNPRDSEQLCTIAPRGGISSNHFSAESWWRPQACFVSLIQAGARGCHPQISGFTLPTRLQSSNWNSLHLWESAG